MNKTKIEYLDYTWNPIAMRCTPISEGCRNCWHLAMTKRLAGNKKICNEFRNAYAGAILPVLIHTELEAPLHLRKPSRIGVQFMGDLFHDDVDSYWYVKIMQVIRKCPHHIFLFLTKRPERMKDILFHWFVPNIPNLWLGVSVEDQKTADERIPILLQIPAVKRFVSMEPMLNKTDLLIRGYLADHEWEHGVPGGLNWVICGGLSLPGGKIQAPKKEWVDSLVDQCDVARVPLFIKPNAKYLIERKEFPQ